MVKLKCIRFLGKCPATFHHNDPGLSAWEVASQFAGFLSNVHPTDAVEFQVEWVDGESYEGSFIPTKDGYDFGSHIRQYAEIYTGKAKPAHLTPEVYKAGMAKVPRATAAKLTKLLKDYDLTGTPRVQDDPAPEVVVGSVRERFSNIPAATFKVVEEDPNAWNADGFFPEPPKDIDNYVDPSFTAAVYNFHPPGRA